MTKPKKAGRRRKIKCPTCGKRAERIVVCYDQYDHGKYGVCVTDFRPNLGLTSNISEVLPPKKRRGGR